MRVQKASADHTSSCSCWTTWGTVYGMAYSGMTCGRCR